MGTFSIWHWLIVFVFFPLLFVVIPIATVKVTARVSRKGLLLRWLATVAIVFVLSAVLGFLSFDDSAPLDPEGANAIVGLVALLSVIPVVRWSAGRAQDAGWSKWLCLLLAFPGMNLIFFFVLLIKGPIQPALLDEKLVQGSGTGSTI